MNEHDKDEYIKKLEDINSQLEDNISDLLKKMYTKEKSALIFKIRNKSTGLFSHGGMGQNVKWSRTGKIWCQKGSLTNHLRYHIKNDKFLNHTSNWEIVTYSIFEQVPKDLDIWWSETPIKKKP